MKNFEDRLKKEISEIRIIDTHEHLETEEERLGQKVDLFHWFSHYASCDLISAGMKPEDLNECRDTGKPLEERWKKFAPYWECVRTTGYGKALIFAAKELYGVNEISGKTFAQLSEKISAANKKGFYKWVLKEKAGIDISLRPEDMHYFGKLDRDFFAPVVYTDGLIGIWNRESIDAISKAFKKEIASVDDLSGTIDAAIDTAVRDGACAAKCGLAYARILKFEDTDKSVAGIVLDRILKKEATDPKPLQDFLMHRMLEKLEKKGLPLQVHTGIQEGNGNYLTNSNPVHLLNLFFRYPCLKFDIFHAGYPYSSELAVMAKNFPNVYADMCWMYVISPTASKKILHDWLDTIPNNKIFGFGGDYIFAEGAYAHSRIAREIIFQVIQEKYKRGWFDEEECLMLARKLLSDNALDFFKIQL